MNFRISGEMLENRQTEQIQNHVCFTCSYVSGKVEYGLRALNGRVEQKAC